ncbi:MAG: 2Fe-2S iron-sulfur cluster binding domain-containing protein [Spirochaetales bacterium]|nr:2Fe-2S iron-sulfur cluster binding domain-containing protein [Spirochaetales bacterium]
MDITFLTGPVTAGLISALLALIITLVDRMVNNYGMVKITINNGHKTVNVKGGSPLLFSLAEEGIFIPSACGGKGTCGTCKVKVQTDIGIHLPTEIPLLQKNEIEENIRLACQVKVKKDIEISIPEDLFAIQQFKTTIASIADVTHDIKEVYVKLMEPGTISFKAGQYAQLIIPPYGKIRETSQRAYSMLSAPADSGRLGFLIRLVPGGIATTYVHTILKEGDTLDVVAPVGEFMLHDSNDIMLCIAGGSGMAPLHSIIYDMVDKGKTNREVWFFFGARNLKELFYIDRFSELEKSWPGFHFIPALSEPLPDDNWKGETGLITEVLDRFLKTRISTEAPKEGYLCGSPGMIDACIRVLINHNIKEENIYFDKFA